MTSSQDRKVKASVKKIDKASVSVSPLRPTCSMTVIEIIKNLKIRKASGPDDIPIAVMKRFPKDFISLLVKVLNNCLQTCHFPRRWKEGKIIAIQKPGKDPTQPTNYRPISLLSNLGKILERLILLRMNEFEETEKIFTKFANTQFGFRKEHSTIHQIIRITEKITKNFNLNKSSGMVLLDVEKAFDSVWHDGLLHKL